MSDEENTGESDRKSTLYFLIAAGCIVLVLAGIFAAKEFMPDSKNPTVTYNSFKFTKSENLWFTQVKLGDQPYNVPLHFNPYEVENIPMIGDIDERFQQSETYITHDPGEKDLGYVALAAAEVSLNMATAFRVTPIAACAANITEACATRPIITCENTNSSVIYLRDTGAGNITRIELKGNCVMIEGHGPELVKAVDKFLYVWYRIIN